MTRDHKPISIADQVFEKLERDILSGKYPQGEILSELRLSGELGVSRTPIREAIRRLEQERILEDSGHGLVVIGISRHLRDPPSAGGSGRKAGRRQHHRRCTE